MRQIRGDRISMIFQEPMTSLNPVMRIGDQIIEAVLLHRPMPRKKAWQQAVDMLRLVRIPEPERRALEYPHQLSGGMRQRAMIAMALMCDPQLLIADEPTTALDVTVQAQILDLMRDLQREFNSALVIITHDLGVVAELADDIMVMYGGKAVEYGRAKTVFTAPEHPYTWGLLSSMPRLDRPVQERLVPIAGNPPSLINVPDGCAFNPRCTYVERCGSLSPSGPAVCSTVVPELEQAAGRDRHLVRCHLPVEVRQQTFETEIRTLL